MKDKAIEYLMGIPGDLAQAVMYPLETLRGDPWVTFRACVWIGSFLALIAWLN